MVVIPPQYYLQELMEDINLQTLRGMWFQHDDAPAHCAGIVAIIQMKGFLNVG